MTQSIRGLEIPDPPPPPRFEPARALHALRSLLADPEQTELAYDVMEAVGQDNLEVPFQRVLAQPDGRRLLVERPDLLARIGDRDALGRLPRGTFGREYLEFIDRNGLDPATLVELSHARRRVGELDPLRRWFVDRFVLMHDLWHVLTGYESDDVGETALLWFTHAQIGGRGFAMLGTGAALSAWTQADRGWTAFLMRAWRRGRRAVRLVAVPYEELLEIRLDDVRRAVGLEPPMLAHRSGFPAVHISPAGRA